LHMFRTFFALALHIAASWFGAQRMARTTTIVI